MKKRILSILAGTMLIANLSYAAPITNLDPGATKAGYNHYNLDSAGLGVKNDSFYLEHGLSSKFNVGIERNNYSFTGGDAHATDIYAHYKLDKNIRLIVGDRSYSSGPDKAFYGIGADVNLAPKLDGYASVTASSLATEWQTGVNYKLDKQASLHLGYKSYKEDNAPTMDGVGFGINYQF